MTDHTQQLRMWLGISHRIGGWVLTKSGKITPYSTMQHVIDSEQKNPNTKITIDDFNSAVLITQ